MIIFPSSQILYLKEKTMYDCLTQAKILSNNENIKANKILNDGGKNEYLK